VLELDLIPKDGTYQIRQSLVDEYARTYPGVDAMSELRAACQWVRDNPARRKTRAGARRYLGGWMSRAQNRSRASPATRLDDPQPSYLKPFARETYGG
jgi:hypothetical protein